MTLVSVIEHAHRRPVPETPPGRVSIKTTFLRAIQFAKASTEAERSAEGAE